MTKQGCQLPDRLPNESDAQYEKRIIDWFRDDYDNASSKGDNRGWTGSLPFHLSREKI